VIDWDDVHRRRHTPRREVVVPDVVPAADEVSNWG